MNARVVSLKSAAAAAFVAGASLAATADTLRISPASGGGAANGPSDQPSITSDGSIVVFGSRATNIVDGDSNNVREVFVRDVAAGTIEMPVFVDDLNTSPDADVDPAAISRDGRFIVLVTAATNLVAGDFNSALDVFLHDRSTGSTVLVSSAGAGSGDALSIARRGSVSANGRFVAFESDATDLVGGDGNGTSDIFVRDVKKGVTTRASVNSIGEEAFEDPSNRAAISANGRIVAFDSADENLAPGSFGSFRGIHVRDVKKRRTARISLRPDGGAPDGDCTAASISANGRFIAFQSDATDLVPGDTNGRRDVFLHDRKKRTTHRISVRTGGAQGTGGDAEGPEISSDGRFVVFTSDMNDLVDGDGNFAPDVFLHDIRAGTTIRVSQDAQGGDANGLNFGGTVSDGGTTVAYISSAADIDPPDDNQETDIFLFCR